MVNARILMCAMALLVAPPQLLVLCGQQQATPQVQKSAAPHRSPAVVGQVVDGTYKNSSIGIEITPAPALQFEEPQLSGTPGTVPFLVMIRASVSGLFTRIFSTKSEMYFYADDLGYYPADNRTAKDYERKVIRADERAGWTTVSHGAPYPMGGNSYERANFVQGDVSESVLITTHNGYAYVFIFAAQNQDSVDKLIDGTKVKLIP